MVEALLCVSHKSLSDSLSDDCDIWVGVCVSATLWVACFVSVIFDDDDSAGSVLVDSRCQLRTKKDLKFS